MTTVKRLGLASVVLVSLAASTAFYATLTARGADSAQARGFNYVALGLVAVLASLLLVVFWRSIHGTSLRVAEQLEQMAQKREIGLVMTEPGSELAIVARSLNRLLGVLNDELARLRAEHRELQIHSRIAEAEKKHTEAIVYSISDAVVVTNRFDELILANEAAERLLSFKLAHSLRKNIDHIVQEGTLVRLIRETRSGARNSTRKVVEHCIDQKGQPRTYNVTLSCVMTPQGEVSGVVTVLHDVTREKEIAQMKTDFVSNVSHELRTPLTSIKGYVEMLVDGDITDEKARRDSYEIIAAETDRLQRLIDNILNISRIESGVVRVVREPLSLTAIAKQAVDVLAPQARTKHIRLVEQLEPVCHQVEADRDMIYQAVLNLASNALKYTPEGGTVTVTTSVDEPRGVAVCAVADTGVGIPAEALPHIFDKFYRVQSHAKLAKGTGLGLTLVKHIVETVHEGKLSVTSEDGKGSQFTFELPLLQ